MNRFYEKLNIPDNCIVENTVFKKAFLENADLTSMDKKIINEHIKKVIWKYCLKPDTINIQPYRSEDRDYLEIEIIEVQLNDSSKFKRIAEIIMRAIPYPILLVLIKDNQMQLITGDMRKNLSDNSKVTVEDFSYSDWIDLDSSNRFKENLFKELNFTKMSYTNFYQMYQDITAKINFYNMSKTKGEIVSEKETNMSSSDAKILYDEINLIDAKIKTLQKQIKKNSSISEKVEISLEISNLKNKKELFLKQL